MIPKYKYYFYFCNYIRGGIRFTYEVIAIAKRKNRYKKNNRFLAFMFLTVFTPLGLILFINFINARNENADKQADKAESTASSSPTEEINTFSYGKGIARYSEINVPDELESIILDFIDDQFEALATLSGTDLTGFFDPGSTESYVNAQINRTSLDYLISLRSMQPVDLTMTGYSFGITYTDLTYPGNGDISITLLEDNQIYFSYLDGIESCSTGIEHSFVFTETADGFKLTSHEKTEDVYSLINDYYLAALDEDYSRTSSASVQEINATLSGIENKLITDAESNVDSIAEQFQDYCGDPEKYEAPNIEWETDYNREAAVAYAMDWVNETSVVRNDLFVSYDNLGGNCNNFVSQCILAGGIPMDNIGTSGLQWKWYGDAISFSQSKSGRSSSWAGVNEFYEYCTYNEGYGMAAWTGDNIFSAQAGDILQFGVEGVWKHSAIITKIIYDDNGDPIDFLINSNTTDRISYPASAYAYSDIRLIRILGYNS